MSAAFAPLRHEGGWCRRAQGQFVRTRSALVTTGVGCSVTVYGPRSARRGPPSRKQRLRIDLIGRRSHQSELHRKQRCAGSVGNTELGVDPFNVVADGLRADIQPSGNGLVRKSLCEQPQYLVLTLGQSTLRCTADSGRVVAGRSQHGIDSNGVEAAGFDLPAKQAGSIALGHCTSIWPGLRRRVINVSRS
jgi:hypothetical protein